MADYDAFISYSHAQDKPVAATLQAAVQRLGKPWYRRRALHVFRDDSSLSATPHLWPSIEQALAQSRYLILLASPQSASSKWVGKEVAYWLANKKTDTLLLAVTDGELGWDNDVGDFIWSPATPLPPVLKGQFSSEPKWVDLRQYRTAAPVRDGKFLDLAADFAAAVHGVSKDDLLSQEVRQQRRALLLAWSAAALLLVLAGAAVWQGQVAQSQRAKAVNALTAATSTADKLVFDMAVELRNQPGMPIRTVVKILGGMQAMQDRLSQAGNATPELRRLHAAALGELSTTMLAQGAWSAARNDAQRAVAIIEDLLKHDLANARFQRDLSVNLVKLGDARLRLSEYAPALDSFSRALSIVTKLADAAPHDGQLQDDLVACLTSISGVQFLMGKRQEALETDRRSIGILEKLVAKQPDNLSWQYDLSQAHNRSGLILAQLGQTAAALKAYQAGLAIRQKLVASDPNNTEFQRGLFDDYTWTGNTFARTGARQNALDAYRKALPLIERLAATDAGNNQWQNELALGYDNVGEMLALGGANDQALDYLQKSLKIRQRIAASEANNPAWQREIEVSQNKIGDALIATGKRDDAIAAYRKALAIALKLAEAAPQDGERQNDLAFCYLKMGDAVAGDDRAKARKFYQKGLSIREKLFAADQANMQLRRALALTHERLGGLDAVDGAADDALTELRVALALRQQVAASDPDNSLWQVELITGLMQLAQAGDEPQSRLEQALLLAQKLDAAGKLNADQKSVIGGIKQALTSLQVKK